MLFSIEERIKNTKLSYFLTDIILTVQGGEMLNYFYSKNIKTRRRENEIKEKGIVGCFGSKYGV